MRPTFIKSQLFGDHVFFSVIIDGHQYKAINGQCFGVGPVCLLEYIGKWTTQQDGFVKSGIWKIISAEEARDTIPEGYRSNFPFPQWLNKRPRRIISK